MSCASGPERGKAFQHWAIELRIKAFAHPQGQAGRVPKKTGGGEAPHPFSALSALFLLDLGPIQSDSLLFLFCTSGGKREREKETTLSVSETSKPQNLNLDLLSKSTQTFSPPFEAKNKNKTTKNGGQEAQRPHHLGRRHRHLEPVVLLGRPDGLQDARGEFFC